LNNGLTGAQGIRNGLFVYGQTINHDGFVFGNGSNFQFYNPLIVQDGSAKSEMSQLITHPQNVHGLGNHFPKFTSVSKYRCLWTPALARLNFL
jgi:hypothetical protein